MMFRFGNAIAIGAFVAALAAQSASAEQIRIAVGLTGDNPLVNGMHRFAEQLEAETRGKWTARIFEMSLLNLAESMTGVRDGVAEVAYVVPAYHRAEFGLTKSHCGHGHRDHRSGGYVGGGERICIQLPGMLGRICGRGAGVHGPVGHRSLLSAIQ